MFTIILYSDNVHIEYRSIAPKLASVGTPTPNARFTIVNYLVYSEKFGYGLARGGPAVERQSDGSTRVAGRLVFTFPALSFEL